MSTRERDAATKRAETAKRRTMSGWATIEEEQANTIERLQSELSAATKRAETRAADNLFSDAMDDATTVYSQARRLNKKTGDAETDVRRILAEVIDAYNKKFLSPHSTPPVPPSKGVRPMTLLEQCHAECAELRREIQALRSRCEKAERGSVIRESQRAALDSACTQYEKTISTLRTETIAECANARARAEKAEAQSRKLTLMLVSEAEERTRLQTALETAEASCAGMRDGLERALVFAIEMDRRDPTVGKKAEIAAIKSALSTLPAKAKAMGKLWDAFSNADNQDWEHLFAHDLSHSGHGKFWRAVLTDVRAILDGDAARTALQGDSPSPSEEGDSK